MTYTYAVLHIQDSSYQDVRRRLLIASPDHKDAIHDDGDGEVIDMQGIALQAESCLEKTKSAVDTHISSSR